jgi:isopentenyl phosphate kinase
MTAAFIIHLEVSDTTPDALTLEAEFVADTLTQNGVAVVSVTPWARPTATPTFESIAAALPTTLSPLEAGDSVP